MPQEAGVVVNRPSVSVIIPAYNASKTIAASVKSALEQTWPPTEVIVVDDGSRDDTVDVVSSIGPAVTLLRQANQGCGQARNTGARQARAEWLAFLDADDAWLPRKLERQAPFTENPRVAVVNCRSMNKAGQMLRTEISFESLWEKNDLIVSSSLVRRSAFEAEGGFWAGRACEDYHLWLRLTAAGWLIANCPEDLVVYSPAPGSLSQQIESFAAAEIACIQDVGARVGLPAKRVRDRVIAAYLKHTMGAIHVRDMALARRFARTSFSLGISGKQVTTMALANFPAQFFDLRRRWLSKPNDNSPPVPDA
jgi:glycosyltransferase involved in cell wall biosynthesis